MNTKTNTSLQFTATLLNKHLNSTAYHVINDTLTNDFNDVNVTLDGNDYIVSAQGELIRLVNYAEIQVGQFLLDHYHQR